MNDTHSIDADHESSVGQAADGYDGYAADLQLDNDDDESYGNKAVPSST